MKKNTLTKTIIILLVVLMAAFAFVACSNDTANNGEEAQGGTSSDLSGDIVIAGSTSVQPLSDVLAEAFTERNGAVKIDIQGGGSGQGIKSIEEKIADLGSLSREVKEEEKAVVQQEYVIAKDGIAAVVNKDVKVENLTLDQLKRIFTGEIKNWKEIGGADAAIVVVAREEGSGTRGAFNELTGVMFKDEAGEEVDATVKSALIQASTGAVIQTVSGTKGAIGYISLGSLDDTVQAVKVEGVTGSNETVIDGSYKLSRPFLYVSGAELSPQAQAFIDFILSPEGQAIVTEEGFVAVVQ
jgi:phosphate transport system substrate-binding protein